MYLIIHQSKESACLLVHFCDLVEFFVQQKPAVNESSDPTSTMANLVLHGWSILKFSYFVFIVTFFAFIQLSWHEYVPTRFIDL